MMAKLREADRVLHVASLRNARDRAQDALEDAHERQRQAGSALREAQKAEEAAAAPMREAYDLHRKAEQDEEAARRFAKGPAAEIEALGRLNAAAAVLARYQAPLHEATAAKETAQALADDAVMGVQAAEEARDAAVWGCEHPGYVPLSGDTVNIPAQPLTRFSLGLDLDDGPLSDVDRMMAALPDWSMAVIAGLARDAENKARIAERKAITAEEARKPRVPGLRSSRRARGRSRVASIRGGRAPDRNVCGGASSHPECPPCAVREPRRVPAPRPAFKGHPPARRRTSVPIRACRKPGIRDFACRVGEDEPRRMTGHRPEAP